MMVSQTGALKGEPLARETASKTDVMIFSWHTPYGFFSSLVFDTVATALYQLGTASSCQPRPQCLACHEQMKFWMHLLRRFALKGVSLELASGNGAAGRRVGLPIDHVKVLESTVRVIAFPLSLSLFAFHSNDVPVDSSPCFSGPSAGRADMRKLETQRTRHQILHPTRLLTDAYRQLQPLRGY